MMHPVLKTVWIAAASGAAIAVLANLVTVPTLLTLILVLIGIGTATTVGLRSDSKRRGIPTRF